jgi:hypothetical protein
MVALCQGVARQVIAAHRLALDGEFAARGRALTGRLMRSGDGACLRVELDLADTIVWLVGEGLVEVEGPDAAGFVVRLKRYDR